MIAAVAAIAGLVTLALAASVALAMTADEAFRLAETSRDDSDEQGDNLGTGA